jgi:hypothetical protein
MTDQSAAELCDNFSPHVERVVRRVWRRRVAPARGDTQETFVRNAVGRILDSMTIPVQATVRIRCANENTIAIQAPGAR